MFIAVSYKLEYHQHSGYKYFVLLKLFQTNTNTLLDIKYI